MRKFDRNSRKYVAHRANSVGVRLRAHICVCVRVCVCVCVCVCKANFQVLRQKDINRQFCCHIVCIYCIWLVGKLCAYTVYI